MGTTAQKLEYLGTTKSQLKDMINYGLDDNNKITNSTTFREYVSSIFNAFLEALRTPDTLFTNLPKKSGTGANITLNDTANAPMRITLGSTALEQETTTGKNLLNADDFTINANQDSTYTYLNYVDLTPGQYTLSWYQSATMASNVRNTPQLMQGSSIIDRQTNDTNKNLTAGRYSWTFTITESNTYRISYWTHTLSTQTTYSNWQLETGSTATNWEKYTGGIPAPNPSYPQDIHTISGSNKLKVEGKNWFDNTITPIVAGGSTSNTINTGYRLVSTVNGPSNSNNACRYVVHDITPFIGQKITLSAHAKSSSTNKGFMYLRLCKENGDVINDYGTQGTSETLDGDLSVSYTIPSGIGEYHYLMVALYSTRNSAVSIGDYVDYTNLQLEVSDSKTSYTPYTLETKDIDLPVENLYNPNQTLVNYQYSSGTWGEDLRRVTSDFIEIEKGQTYTIYCDLDNENDVALINYNLFDSSKNWLGDRSTNGEAVSFSGDKIHTFTVTLANSKYIRITFRRYSNANSYLSISAVQNSEIQFEKGSKANAYTPYGTTPIECGSIGNYENIPIRTFGKNLFEPTANSQSLSSGGTLTKNDGNTYTVKNGRTDFADLVVLGTINVENGKTYYLYNAFSDNNNNLSLRRGSTMIVATSTNNVVSYTATATETLNVYIRYQSTSTFTFTPMVAYSSPTSYEPYGNGTWYLKGNIDKYVFNGNEAWEDRPNFNDCDRFVVGILSSMKLSAIISAGGYSNYFKVINAINSNIGVMFNNGNTQIGINFSTKGTTTLADFKSWLTTHNTEYWYVRTTPEYTPITGTLAEQLENVYQKMLSQKGVTNISQINDDLSFNLSVQAIEDLE